MRSNGLTASAYTPVADLDPRVADALLEELKRQGVAAYTKPVESTSMSGFDRPEFRTDVKDRLYVDAAESARVETLISEQDPTLVTTSDDLTWAQIVAGFDQPTHNEVNPWPVSEDLDLPLGDAALDTEVDAAADPAAGGPVDGTTDLRGWLAGRDATRSPIDTSDETHDDGDLIRPRDREHDATDREAGHQQEETVERFVPPPPPPLPQLEPWQQLAWVGLIGGPLLLLVSVIFSIQLPTWVALAAVAGFVGGFVTLVATMQDRDDSGDDPDNGAVV